MEELFWKNRVFADDLAEFDTETHAPKLVSVSCCDARVPQGELFGNVPGEHFTVANIGNSVRTRDEEGAPIVAGSVVYPIQKTDPENIVIIGHTHCGAVTAAYQQVAEGAADEDHELQNELDLLRPHVEQGLEQFDAGDYERAEVITRLVEYNVDRQVDALLDHTGDLPLFGVVCDLHGYYPGSVGQVHLVNFNGRRNPEELPDALRPNFHRKLDY